MDVIALHQSTDYALWIALQLLQLVTKKYNNRRLSVRPSVRDLRVYYDQPLGMTHQYDRYNKPDTFSGETLAESINSSPKIKKPLFLHL